MTDLTPFTIGDFARCRADMCRVEITSELFKPKGFADYVHAARVCRLNDGVYRIEHKYRYLRPSEMLQILPSWQEIQAVTKWKPRAKA